MMRERDLDANGITLHIVEAGEDLSSFCAMAGPAGAA
jgi:hypothetical protein